MDQALKDIGAMFVADDEAAEVLQPTVRSLDEPPASKAAQFAAVLRLRLHSVRAVGTDQVDPSFAQPFAERITVGGEIVDQTFQSPRAAVLIEQRFDQRHFARRGAVDVCGQGNSMCFGERHDLGSLAGLCLANLGAPLFARENEPSAKASSTLILPSRSSWRNPRCQAFRKTPEAVHSCNLRQQVGGDGKDFGKSFHRAPVRKIHRMPSKQARGSMRGRPPARDGGSHGNRSAMRNHCSSVSCDSGSVMEAPLYRPAEGHQWNFKSMCVPPFRGTHTQIACQSFIQ